MIGAGYPAVVMKSDQKAVTIGVSADDISRVSRDSKVMIDGTTEAGIVVFDSDTCVIGDSVSLNSTRSITRY